MAHAASTLLNPRGLVVLTGAAPVYSGGTPGMLAYGCAKAAVHHMVRTLARSADLPAEAAVVGLLPVTIDTPANRAAMPTADFAQWTPPADIAQQLLRWSERAPAPVSGAFYAFRTAQAKTVVEELRPQEVQ